MAAGEGRLVWRGPESLALLQPPGKLRRPAAGHGVRIALLRLAERQWEMLLLVIPPAVLFSAALLTVAVRNVLGPTATLLTGLLLVLTAMVYIGILMLCGAVNGFAWLIRALGSAQPADDRIAAEELPGRYWSMTLCHQADGARTNELLRQVSQRLARLVTVDVDHAASELGAQTPLVKVAETLVCLRRGITTERMRDAVTAWAGQPRSLSEKSEVIIRMSANPARRRAMRLFDSGGFFFWYVAAVATHVAVVAMDVAEWERAGCAGGDCAGRPVTYPLALRWLAQRLLFTDPADLQPGTFKAWSIGWLTSLLSLVGLFVMAAAIRQYRTYRQARVTAFERGIDKVNDQTRVLIMVASSTERDAVLSNVRNVNATEPERVFLTNHTVLELGSIGNARLMLVQTEQGAVGPGAAAITATSLIMRLNPDYLILTGICFGLQEGVQQPGDIVVCTQLRAIDHRYVGEPESAGGREQVLVLGDYVSPSQTLLDRFRAAELDWHTARVHFGPLLSSSVLVNSAQLRADLLRLQPGACGGEMEGAGVYAAAAPGKVDWIVVKGISDWGYGKTEEWKKLAARNAAEFVVHTIQTGALDDEPVPGVI
ncbi:MAG TPA: 5'-methylthioadenosine/S-adenosylhomocysteine nucleosidase [Micromonosporaceae bacterium]|nr:5'-methylthioadenosine/S-adenosylhomocysteine nucleosidase [Micromonosporaceae bacterium]